MTNFLFGKGGNFILKYLRKFLIFFSVFVFIGGIYFTYKKVKAIQRVETFRPLVESFLPNDKKKQQLILSIILTESKGLGTDIMQSSESMSLKQNQLSSPKESIQYGIKHFNEIENYGKKLQLDEWSIVQSYNFGLDYLNFLKEKGESGYTVKNAETYSRDYLAPRLGNANKKTYRYLRTHSIFYNGGSLFENGGNFFYAKIVKENQRLVSFYEKYLL